MSISKKSSKIPGLTKEEVSEMSQIFKQLKNIEEVIVFGSRAMGNHKPGSDVDLALKGKIDENTLFEVRDFLEEETLLPYFFDVLDYEEIQNSDLKKHIQEQGKVIYKKSA